MCQYFQLLADEAEDAILEILNSRTLADTLEQLQALKQQSS
jgi:DNA-binding IscR family transcriptional regulator